MSSKLIALAVSRSNAMAIKLAGPIVEGNMTSQLRISRTDPEAITWDPVAKKVVVPPGDVIWEPDPDAGPDDLPMGIGAVKTVSGPVTLALGDEPQYFSSTFITIPMRAPTPQVNDIVQVLTSPDPKLVDRFYRIVDVELGGQLPVLQRLQVVGIQPSPGWHPQG